MAWAAASSLACADAWVCSVGPARRALQRAGTHLGGALKAAVCKVCGGVGRRAKVHDAPLAQQHELVKHL